MAGSRWNYLLQRADKLVRENKFTGISSNYQKFLCLMILDKTEQLCSLTGKEEFDIEYISGVINSAYDIPPHISGVFTTSMINRGILIPVDNSNIYRIAPEYRHRKIKELITLFDKAGINKDAIEEAQTAHEHKNASLLWEYINGEKDMNEECWDIPLENFFNAKIDAPAQKKEDAPLDTFFDKITSIFK